LPISNESVILKFIGVKYFINSSKIIQTLENSKVSISRLKWSEANIYDNQLMKPIFKLAAADEHGMISIWNTFESKLINELIDSSNSISSGSKVISKHFVLPI